MKKFRTIYFILTFMFSSTLYAGESIYGIYSNMSAAEGEPSGMEVFILNDGRSGQCNQSLIFQVFEGWPQYPELLDCCACTSNKIEFDSKKWGKFVGKITAGALTGEFVDAKYKISLNKGASFWQQQ